MALVSTTFKLLWMPYEFRAPKPFEQPETKIRWGWIAGIIGFGFLMAWLIPPGDLVYIRDNQLLEDIASKAVGFVLGFIFFLMLWWLEVIYLRIMGIKKATPAIMGAMLPWAVLPFVAVILRGLYPYGIASAGYSWLIWAEIIVFLAWHTTWIGLLLSVGNCIPTRRSSLNTSQLVPVIVLLTMIEIVLAYGFLYVATEVAEMTIPELFLRWM